jgi:signal transduction histidine kinase/ligand-binding sensor domain-containing protein
MIMVCLQHRSEGGVLLGGVALWCTLLAAAAWAQSGPFGLTAISIEQGLSAASAQCLAQDERGFLWVGTHDGLNRYDGYGFTTYRHDARDPASLSVNNVWALWAERRGTLWAGTRGGGLCRYEPARDGFTCYRHTPGQARSLRSDIVLTLYEDRANTLWIGTLGGGLCRYDRGSDDFTCFQMEPGRADRLPHNDVRALYEDRAGEFWVGTQGGGLCRFDRRDGACVTYRRAAGRPQTLSSDFILSLTEDDAGAFWVGTLGGGLCWFDRRNGIFRTYRHEPNRPDSLPNNTVIALSEDRAGEFWVGTLGGGLSRLDRRRGSFAPQAGLLSDDVRAIFQDQQDTLWVGTSGGGGLHRLTRAGTGFVTFRHAPEQPRSLRSNVVFALRAETSGVVWAGTLGGGLCRSQPDRSGFTCFQRGSGASDVYALLSDRHGELWLGTNGEGLCRFDRQREAFACYRDKAGGTSSNFVLALAEDQTGGLWAGTNGAGLCRFDRRRTSFDCFRHNSQDPRSLSGDAVRVLYVTRAGTLWAGTNGAGLCRFEGAAGFTCFRHNAAQPGSLSNNDIRALFEDGAGRLWVGTDGGGLNLFEPATSTFRAWRTSDGLPNDTICGIQADAQGGLWLSTNNGLARFDYGRRHWSYYDVSDGLQGNEFATGASCQSPQGELFFGGTRGFTAFFPERLNEHAPAPPVVLTGFRKFNQPVRLQPPLDELTELHLTHRDSVIGFEFTALDLTGAQRYRYRYRLAGFNDNWIDAGKQRLATFTNLDAGHYLFEVAAAAREDGWPAASTRLRVVVEPPFWKSWWFLLLAGSAVLGLGVMAYQTRVGQLERARQAQENFSRQLLTSQERERQRIAAELHDSLGQRLVVIKNLTLLLLQSKLAPAQAQQQIGDISEETSRAIHEVKEISYNLRPHQLEQVGLTKTLQGLVKQVAHASGIAITAELDPLDQLFAPADEINFYRIVQEGLNNIVKHSSATTAQLIILCKDTHVEMTLQDNGRGIANLGWLNANGITQANLPSASRQPPAGGFGLKGIAERVRMLGGTYTLESAPGAGTRLQIKLALPHESTD